MIKKSMEIGDSPIHRNGISRREFLIAGIALPLGGCSGAQIVANKESTTGAAPPTVTPPPVTPPPVIPPPVSTQGGPLSIATPAALPGATQGSDYSQSLLATGGTPPYVGWRLTSGALNPFGSQGFSPTPTSSLTLSYAGLLNATPLPNAETDQFTLQVTDSVGATAVQNFTLVAAAATPTFSWTTQSNTIVLDSALGSNPRYFISSNWSARFGSQSTQGYSERYWTVQGNSGYVAGSVAGYPFCARGWYKSLGFGAKPGSAPLQSAGIQISALTKAKIRWIMETPIDRTQVQASALIDNYFHTIASPDGTNTGHNVPVMSLMIVPWWLDSSGVILGYLNSGTELSPKYSKPIQLDGKMWFYHLANTTAAQTAGSAQFNSISLFPAPWNDLQQGGVKFVSIDYKQLVTDLLALKLGIALTHTHYMSNITCGWAISAAGSDAVHGSFRTLDLQVSLQSETDPVISVVPELSQLISRGVPLASAHSWNDTLSAATNADFDRYLTSSIGAVTPSNPAEFDMDFSAVASSLKKNGLISLGFGVDHTTAVVGYWTYYEDDPPRSAYDFAVNFTIDANPAGFSGGKAPASGWVNLVTTLNNKRARLAYKLGDWSAYNSLRIRVTQTAGTNTDASLKVNVWSAPTVTNPNPDGWIFFGDSVTQKCMVDGTCEEGCTGDYMGNVISQYTGHVPLCVGAGLSGWSLNAPGNGYPGMLPFFDGTTGTWINDFPGRYVWLALGINDPAGGNTADRYQAGLVQAIKIALAAHKICIIPSIWYSYGDGGQQSTETSGWITRVINSSGLIYGSTITNGGSGYSSGEYDNVPITGGSGSGAMARIIVSGGVITSVGVFQGSGYKASDAGLSAANVDLGGGNGRGFTFAVSDVISFAGNSYLIAGPDLNTIGKNFRSIMFVTSEDAIHPNGYGQPVYRALCTDWIARVIYLGMPASAWKPDFSVGAGIGGFQSQRASQQ